MYDLSYFKEKDGAVVLSFMKQHPFALLTGVDANQQPVATQIPFLFRERDGYLYLQGHIMKKTDHHLAFEQNPQVLAVFTGPHTYVSASWYENPKQASTWNYISVHARGTLSFLGEDALLSMLEELTAHFEGNPASPASFRELPKEYVHSLAKAIIGFEIKVTDMENVFKLSQNHEAKNYARITEKLSAQDTDGQAIAKEMEQRKNQLFPHA